MQVNEVGPTPNRWPGAFTGLEAIVLHDTEGGGDGSLAWMLNPSASASALIEVKEDGSVWKLGDWGDAFWHAGVVNAPLTPLAYGTNPNLRMQGIEFAGFNTRPLTAAQFAVAPDVCRLIWGAYGVASSPLIPHAWIDTINRFDPGADNYVALVKAIAGGGSPVAGTPFTQEQIDWLDNFVKATIRLVIPAEAFLTEDAIRAPGGYGQKLQAWIDANLQYKSAALKAAANKRLKAALGGKKKADAAADPFAPVPKVSPAMDLRGPVETWPEPHRSSGRKGRG
jgi:hypothetical protein